MGLVPFWFSMEHLWILIAPFWLSTDEMNIAANLSSLFEIPADTVSFSPSSIMWQVWQTDEIVISTFVQIFI